METMTPRPMPELPAAWAHPPRFIHPATLGRMGRALASSRQPIQPFAKPAAGSSGSRRFFTRNDSTQSLAPRPTAKAVSNEGSKRDSQPVLIISVDYLKEVPWKRSSPNLKVQPTHDGLHVGVSIRHGFRRNKSRENELIAVTNVKPDEVVFNACRDAVGQRILEASTSCPPVLPMTR